MGGPVWKRINVVGPQTVNGLNVAGYGQSEPEKSWTVPSLIYVVRTSNNRVIAVHELYCCLLPRCEALHTCRSGFSDHNKMVL